MYWEDGAQVTSPKDKAIIHEVNSITDYETIATMSREEAESAGRYHVIGKEIDDAYIEELKIKLLTTSHKKRSKKASKLSIHHYMEQGTSLCVES